MLAPEVVLFQRAKALQVALRYEQALDAYDAAWQARPGYAAPLVGKAMLLMSLKRFEAAREALDRAIAAKPGYAEARYVKGELLLLLGERREGWTLYESRLASRNHRDDPRTSPIPCWHGEPLPAATLLVHGEFGLGDFLMFARYLPLLEPLVGRVVLLARDPLVRLLAASFPGCTVVGKRTALPAADVRCSVLSLPHLLDARVPSIPAGIPYLTVPEPVRAKWQARLGPRSRPRVGVMAAGNSDRELDRDPLRSRSLPATALGPLLQLPVEFHSLQRVPAGLPALVDHSPAIEDLADTGALALQMDLVVSVDTSVAHLAGGLGVPLWVLLPFASDYRWERGAVTSWYPHAHLFRQQVPGQWDAPVRDAAAAMPGHLHLGPP
jgi:hypothetical protein